MILFTSGTTNMPKAIMLTEDNICSNIKGISAYLKLTIEDRILLIKDLSHSSSIIGELFVGLFNGCSVILTTKFLRVTTILSLIQEYNITVFFAVPTLLTPVTAMETKLKSLKKYHLPILWIMNFIFPGRIKL